VIHRGKVADGTFTIGDKVTAVVSKDREAIKKNHTATHLLQWALQQVMGSSVAQQGSLVSPEYLRFDFTCPKALTPEQAAKVEKLVRERIDSDDPVAYAVMPREQAEKLGAMALFGEKYGSEVRVVAIGAPNENTITAAFSREFCGGTHVDRLGVIGGFKIIKEESISAGVRRITALTGKGLDAYLSARSDIADQLSAMLKVPADELPARIEQLVNENKRLAKELKAASKTQGADVMDQARQLLEKCEKIGSTSVIIATLETTSVEQARNAIDMLKKKAGSAAIFFAFGDGDKATLIAAVTDDLIEKGLKAGDIVKQTAPIVDGGGGGRPQMAQAGGKNPAKIPDALAKAEEVIKAALAN
jgi:alanyl-tRNA synthetase